MKYIIIGKTYLYILSFVKLFLKFNLPLCISSGGPPGKFHITGVCDQWLGNYCTTNICRIENYKLRLQRVLPEATKHYYTQLWCSATNI